MMGKDKFLDEPEAHMIFLKSLVKFLNQQSNDTLCN